MPPTEVMTAYLNLDEHCPHCGTNFVLQFKRELPDGPLLFRLVAEYGFATPWKPLKELVTTVQQIN